MDESGREIGEWSWDEKLDITDDWPRRDPEAAAAWRMARFGAPLSSQPVRDHWPPSGMRGILAQSAHSSVGSLTTARRTAHKLSADTQPAVLAIKAVPVVVTRLAPKGAARQGRQHNGIVEPASSCYGRAASPVTAAHRRRPRRVPLHRNCIYSRRWWGRLRVRGRATSNASPHGALIVVGQCTQLAEKRVT